MIANSAINENGIIFSHPTLVGPAGFLKNQFNNPSTLPFFWTFYCPFRKGVGDRKDLICKDVYLYAVWVYWPYLELYVSYYNPIRQKNNAINKTNQLTDFN